MLKKIIVVTTVIIIIALLFIPLFPRLVLNNVKNNKVNMILNIKNKKFIISYAHSVNKSKVRDYYIIDKDNNIILEKTRFVSYGAGIPEPEDNENFVIIDDYMEINNMNRIIENLYLFIGVTANHTIMTDEKIIELDNFFKPQTNVKIEYKRISIFEYIKSFLSRITYRWQYEKQE